MRLLRAKSIMENDPERMPGPLIDFAHSVTHLRAIESSLPFDGAEVGGEQKHIAPARFQDDRFRLCSRYLLRHHELPPGVVRLRLIEEQHQLHGKKDVSIQVLVQRVMASRAVSKNEDGWQRLVVVVTEFLKLGKSGGEALINP